MLASLGFYTGNKTGNFGALTADAVMAYQKSKGLTADGIAGKKTLAAINADYSGKGSTSAGTTNGTTAPSTQTAGNVIYETSTTGGAITPTANTARCMISPPATLGSCAL